MERAREPQARPVKLPAPKRADAIPAQIADRIASRRGAGSRLGDADADQLPFPVADAATRARVHDDPESDLLTRALGARAFTVGEDVFFRGGAFDPRRPEGRALLAHELAHVEQQRDAAPSRLELGRAGDPAEREAAALARGGAGSPVSVRDRVERVRREEIPLEGWGNVWWPAHDDSSWTVVVRADLLVGGRLITRMPFVFGQRLSLQIPLNTDGILRLSASIEAERDDKLGNPTNSWDVQFDWRVRVDGQAHITIMSPTYTWTGGAGSLPWSLTTTPIQGDQSVGLGFTLQNLEQSGSHGFNIAPSIQGGDKVQVGVSGGYTYTTGTHGSPESSGYGVVLDLTAPTPPAPEVHGRVDIGPVTVSRRYAFYFVTGQARLGRNPHTGSDQNVELTSFLHALDWNHDRGSTVAIAMSAYSSPLGFAGRSQESSVELNRDLARRRAAYVAGRIRDVLPRAHVDPAPQVFGSDRWAELGVPDVDDDERHRVVVIEVENTIQPDFDPNSNANQDVDPSRWANPLQ